MHANNSSDSGRLVDKLYKQQTHPKEMSYEYIRGLTDGEGCFTFYPVKTNDTKHMIPAFVISMSERDKELLQTIADKLKIKTKIYAYPPRQRKDGYRRQGMAVFLVRGFGDLKNTIVPLFYKKLCGYKGKQFREWIDKIAKNENVPERYKLIPKLCEWGFYDKNPKFID